MTKVPQAPRQFKLHVLVDGGSKPKVFAFATAEARSAYVAKVTKDQPVAQLDEFSVRCEVQKTTYVSPEVGVAPAAPVAAAVTPPADVAPPAPAPAVEEPKAKGKKAKKAKKAKA